MALGIDPSQGATGAFSGFAQNSMDKAMQLKMHNALIEHQMELQKKQEEDRYLRENVLNDQSLGALNAFAKDNLGLKQDLFTPGENINSGKEKIQMLDTLLRAKAMSGKTVHHVVNNPDGSQSMYFMTPDGQPIGQSGVGLSKKTADDLQSGRTAYQNFKSFTETTSQKLADIATAAGGIGGLAQGAKLTLNQLSQSDPKAKAFIDQLPFDAATLDKRVLGSIRAGGQLLMKNTENAIFNRNDTAETVLQKMINLKQAGVDQVKSAYDSAPAYVRQTGYPADIAELQPGYQEPDTLQHFAKPSSKGGSVTDHAANFRAFMEAKKNR